MSPYGVGHSHSDDRAVALKIMRQLMKEAEAVADHIERTNNSPCSSLYQIKEKEQEIRVSCDKLRSILWQGTL